MPGRILVDTTPLRTSRDFRLLFVGQTVSTLGSQLTVAAIPYQVYHLTHSSLQVGAVSLAQLVPLIVGSLVGGAVGDAVDRRALLLASTGGLALTSAVLALNAEGHTATLLVVYVASAAAAGLIGFANTARNASVPVLVPMAQLAAAYAFMQVIIQVGTVVGPALFGPLFGLLGLGGCYGLDALTYVAALVTVALMARIPPVPGAARPGLHSFAEGFRYLRGRHVLQGIYLIDVNAMVFGMPRALFPALSVTTFAGAGSSATVLGLLYAAPGAGALVGALTTGWVDRLRRQGWAIAVAVVVWGAAIAAFGLVDVFWLALVLLAVAGWADVISAVLRNTMLQRSIPERFRSRLSAIQMAVVQGGPRLGDLESGLVGDLVSTEFAVVSGGLACIAGAAVLVALLPGFRRQRTDDPPAADAGGAP